MGARRGQPGAVAPLELENDDVICCVREKYPKSFARAFSARIKYLKLSLKRRKNREHFRSFGATKIGHFCQCRRFCPPPLENFLRAPMGGPPRFLVGSMVKMKEFSGQGGLAHTVRQPHRSLNLYRNLNLYTKSHKCVGELYYEHFSVCSLPV